jgi:transposase
VGCHQADVTEQAARRAACGRPPCPQRHLLGLALRRTAARSSAELRTSYDLLQSLRSLAAGWRYIPPKRNRKEPICFSPYLHKARNLVDRYFNKIKQCRRIATRYDKLAANYLAFIKLASIRIWLRVYQSAP